MEKWARAMYQPTLPMGKDGRRLTGSKEHIELSKNAAKEGMVLLKNERGLLPLAKGTRLAVFGKAAFDYVKGGGGSGDVTVAYSRNLYEGLQMQREQISIFEPLCDYYRKDVEAQYAKGSAPGMTIEPAVPQELLSQARAYTDTALVTICRFSGEGWDRKSIVDGDYTHLAEGERQMAEASAKIFQDGDFCLSVDETAMVAAVKKNFPKVIVVMNVGGMVDTSWFAEDEEIGAVLMAWQGGIEGGLAAAELLVGKGNPSGKLSDTFAKTLQDYPSTDHFHESKDYVDYTDGYTPAVRARERFKVWKAPYKEGMRPFKEVAEGHMTVKEFLAQMLDEEVAELLGGQPNLGVANTFGYGNLPEYGVPSIMTADGPAGLRILPECGVHTTCWPCSTLLACTWDPEVVEAVGAAGGAEVKENNIAMWLTPAVNIHRSPLCGRNFEYYSEDPFLTGRLAGAMVRGIQSNRIGATVKHFALNNKETNRKNSDSRVSERAAREIYLKAFEMIVKEADPWSIMTSYNIVNGHRASENRDLLEGILRREWGYEGCVTTDWWTCGEHYKEVKAGNDVKMGCGYPERLLEALKKGCLTRQEMDACAERILELILKVD